MHNVLHLPLFSLWSRSNCDNLTSVMRASPCNLCRRTFLTPKLRQSDVNTLSHFQVWPLYCLTWGKHRLITVRVNVKTCNGVKWRTTAQWRRCVLSTDWGCFVISVAHNYLVRKYYVSVVLKNADTSNYGCDADADTGNYIMLHVYRPTYCVFLWLGLVGLGFSDRVRVW